MKMTSGRGGGREEGRGRAIVGHRQQAKGGSQCQTGLLRCAAGPCLFVRPATCPLPRTARLKTKQNTYHHPHCPVPPCRTCHVAQPSDGDAAGGRQVNRQVPVLRVPVVPPHKLSG